MSVKRKTESRAVARKSVGRKKRSSGGRSVSEVLINLVLPLMLIVLMLGVIGTLAFIGYRGATKSEFFKVRNVEVRGNRRIETDAVKGVVEANTAEKGLWSTDLETVKKALLSSSKFMKDVSVSRQLPDTVTVTIVERVPQAIIRKGDDDYWVDDEGVVLASVSKSDDLTGWFVMTGWETSADDKNSPRDSVENKKRVKLYTRIREEATNLSVIDRVKSIDTSDLNSVRAYLSDGRIEVILGRDDFGARLANATKLTATEDQPITIDVTLDPPIKTPRPIVSRAPKTEKEKKTDSAKSAKQDSAKDNKKSDSSKKKN